MIEFKRETIDGHEVEWIPVPLHGRFYDIAFVTLASGERKPVRYDPERDVPIWPEDSA